VVNCRAPNREQVAADGCLKRTATQCYTGNFGLRIPGGRLGGRFSR